jgi:DNA (cytosine-5)-methyltransferase 1
MRGWGGYDNLIEKLERLGYFVRPEVLDAQDFLVPQSRRRLFLICDQKKFPRKVLPLCSVPMSAESVIQFGRWASRPLAQRAQPTIDRANRAIQMLKGKKPFLVVYYGSDGAGGWQPLDRPLRTLTTLDRFGLVTWEGSTPMLRMLQVPELLKAMGFGDEFKLLQGSRRDQIKLLGNGVCPPVMREIVRTLTN